MWNRQVNKVKLWQKITGLLCGLVAVVLPLAGPDTVQAAVPAPAVNWVRIGGSMVGELYADRDSLQPYTKDGSLYLGIMVQEKFTNREFLNIMRKNPGLEELTSSLTLYMFGVKERSYFIASQFYLDTHDMVCLDMGAEEYLRPVSSEKAVQMIFEYTLLEARRDSSKAQQ